MKKLLALLALVGISASLVAAEETVKTVQLGDDEELVLEIEHNGGEAGAE